MDSIPPKTHEILINKLSSIYEWEHSEEETHGHKSSIGTSTEWANRASQASIRASYGITKWLDNMEYAIEESNPSHGYRTCLYEMNPNNVGDTPWDHFSHQFKAFVAKNP